MAAVTRRDDEPSSARQGQEQVQGKQTDVSSGETDRSGSIARRAYERFEARGGEHGHDQEDWFEAERELSSPGRG